MPGPDISSPARTSPRTHAPPPTRTVGPPPRPHTEASSAESPQRARDEATSAVGDALERVHHRQRANRNRRSRRASARTGSAPQRVGSHHVRSFQDEWAQALKEYQEALDAAARAIIPQAATHTPLGKELLEVARWAGLPMRQDPAALHRLAAANRRMLELIATRRDQIAQVLVQNILQQANKLLDHLVDTGVISQQQAEHIRQDAAALAQWAQRTAETVLQWLDQAQRAHVTVVGGMGLDGQVVVGLTGSAAVYMELSAANGITEAGIALGGGATAGVDAEASASHFLQFYWRDASALEGTALTISLGAGTVVGIGLDLQLLFSVDTEANPPLVPVGIGVSVAAEVGSAFELDGSLTWGTRIPLLDSEGDD